MVSVTHWLKMALAVALLGIAGRANVASAQEGAAPFAGQSEPQASDARARARERFVRGLDLAKAERWDEALAEFTASVELFRTGAALQNRAVSLVHLRRYAEARDTYELLMREFGARLGHEEREGIQQEIAELDAAIGELFIATEPPAVEVVIDGQHVGTTPLLRPVRVSAGTHTVRLFRTDYAALEQTVTVAGGQSKTIHEKLVPLRRVGTLVVREASGQSVDVTIDGALVGRAPWQGQLSPGLHNAALRGPGNLGSVPSAAEIRADETVTLVLRAVPLDAALSVTPSPPDARVFINGVWVGNGVWQGRLPAGAQRVEVAARGHLPDTRKLDLARGTSEHLQVVLERDPSHPLWSAGFAPYLYAEGAVALGWAPSFRGGAERSCDTRVDDLDGARRAGCSSKDRPLGVLAGVHVGYQLTPRLGLEVFLHYLALSASQRRRVEATMDEPGRAYSDSVKDETSLRGPAFGISARYQLPSLPILARIWTGVLRAHVETRHSGNYSGRLDDGLEFDRDVRFEERAQDIWIPFLGPELGVRHALGSRFEVGAGVAALLFLPGSTPRTGTDGPLAVVTGRRRKPFHPQLEEPAPGGNPVNLGNLELPREEALGTFWALFPNVRFRANF